MGTITYGSSLRAAPVAATLEKARYLGARLGITRVTDITRLDRVGIPVFVSIRPDAMSGSLCVNAGKGVTPEEACVGAWMEAIEYALAEPGASAVPVTMTARIRDVLDGGTRPAAILDLCPILGAEIALDETLECVVATEILTGASCLLPAELIFLPARSEKWFGSGSGGLASGNTLLEATVHGICELIEHDICSFLYLGDTAVLVREETFPERARDLARALSAVGDVRVHYQKNVFGLPFFRATVRDAESDSPLFFNGGYGCHPHPSIALVRALCEAAQSRLSFIHGGRDDLTDWTRLIQKARSAPIPSPLPTAQEMSINFAEIPDWSREINSIEDCYQLLLGQLEKAGFNRICCVALTPPAEALQVVRVVIPGLEAFDPNRQRVGPRLNRYAQHVD
jgi:ribosomal protein S12 methylthiotransferase accessory factor